MDPTHLVSIAQNLTSHCLPPAAWKAPAMGRVSGLVALNLPQYAIAEVATYMSMQDWKRKEATLHEQAQPAGPHYTETSTSRDSRAISLNLNSSNIVLEDWPGP